MTEEQKCLKLIEIQKFLMLNNINTSLEIFYSEQENKFDSYLNLCTEAKSHLYLFSDGNLIGRYKTVDTINMDCLELDDNFLILMCENFLDSMCGRDYGNPSWIKLCLKLNLMEEKIEYYRK